MKLTTWIVLITVMITFLSLVGFPTSFSSILGSVGIMESGGVVSAVDAEGSSFWSFLFGSTAGFFITLLLTSSVSAGLYLITKDTNLLSAPFIIWVGSLFISSFVMISQVIIETHSWWMTGITTIIFGGLMVGYIGSSVDYFFNR